MLDKINDFPERAELLSPTIMAYIGDSLFELFIRTYLLEERVSKPDKLHQRAVDYVNAEAQAELLDSIRDDLTEAEARIVRRGRNASQSSSSNIDQATYQQSTAFESLLGYLYLTEKEARLLELFNLIRREYRNR